MSSCDNAGSPKSAELKAALQGLYFTSESDYPLELICWTKLEGKGLDLEFVKQQLGLDEAIPAEEGDAQEFLQNCAKIESWFGDDEKKNAQGFQRLQEFLSRQLANLKLFRLGEIEVTVVVAGESAANVLGFKTTSIET